MIKRRGQTILVSTIVLVVLILAISSILHSSSIIYQRVRYEESKEIIDGIGEDSNRLLTNILAFSTESYKSSSQVPLGKVHYYFSYWSQTMLQAYYSRGVQINLTESQNPIELHWNTNPANSSIKGRLDVSIPRMNLFGWNKTYQIAINMKLNNIDLGYNELNLTISKENGLPLENLKKSSFIVNFLGIGADNVNQTIEAFYNLGGGNYLIDLNKTKSLISPFYPLRIIVTDNRGISVSLNAMSWAKVLLSDGFEGGFNKTRWQRILIPNNSTAPIFMNVTGSAPATVPNQNQRNETVQDSDGTIPHTGSRMLMMGHRDFAWEPRPGAQDYLKVTLNITGAKYILIKVWFRMASRDQNTYDYLSIWANRTNTEQLWLKNATNIQQYNPNNNRGNRYTINTNWMLATGNFTGGGYPSLSLIFLLVTGTDQMYKTWVYIDDVQVIAYY